MKKLLTFFFIMPFSLSIMAADEPGATPQAAPSVVEESSANRVGQTYELLVMPVGIGPNPLGGSGLSFGYHLNPDQLITFEFTSGKVDESLSSRENVWDYTSSFQIKSESFGVHYKSFTGNSFYYRAGLDYRSLSYDRNSNFFGTNESISFRGQSVTASFYIGNQWQWENFTLGCDWVGISAPLFSSVSDEQLNGAAQANAEFNQGRLKAATNDYVKGVNLNLLRFYLGASF